MIREKAITRNYVTKRELLNYVEENFHASLAHGWICCFLERRADFVKKTIVSPGELLRLHAQRQYLN
jgi:hypothetical protein